MEDKNIRDILDILKTLFRLKSSLIGGLRDEVKKHDLNRSETFVLLHISESRGKSMGQLCRDVNLKPGSLTSVIDDLVSKGYVRRDTDPDDRRKIIVKLSGKGEKLANNLCRFMGDNALKKIKGLSKSDREAFYKSLDTLRDIADKLKDDT